MIVDFPDAKRVMMKALNALLRQQLRDKAPMMSLIKHKGIFEGHQNSIVRADGSSEVSDLHVVEGGFSIAQQDVATTTFADVAEKMAAAAEDMAGQLERNVFRTLTETITKVGNAISNPLPPGREVVLQALEKIWIDFEDDDRAKPVKPTIVAHPTTVEAMMKREATRTEPENREFDRREAAILDQKYKEYMANLASRAIMD